MKSKFMLRSGAAIGVLIAAVSAAPAALADSTTDVGPATVTLGGFLAMETLYRSRNEGSDIGSTFSGIPFPSTSTAHTSELRFSARQSRLSLLVQGNADSDTHLAFYGEFDFMAGPGSANSNESNSYSPRIRNVYGTVDWDAEGVEFLAGQNWSLLTLNSHGITPRNEVPPATIDAQYSVGFAWARQPQLRIVKNWDHQIWLALSVENPQTTFAGGPGGPAAIPGITVVNTITGASEFDKAVNTLSLNHVPDVIGKAAWEPMIGDSQPLHMELFGIYRSFYSRVLVASPNLLGLPAGNGNINVSGGGFGGSIAYSVLPKVLDLQISAMHGSGIGRYGSGQLPDVTFKANGELAPIQETMVLFGATWHTTPLLDLYTYLGQESEQPKYFNITNTFVVPNATIHGGLGNPAVVTTGCAIEGGACSVNLQKESQVNGGFWWRIYQGRFGSFRFGAQYSYTKLKSFAGVGGVHAPTDDSMFFTSIRYYPF
ncbi:MAG TPA: hypothetical protein VKB67_05210 [Rhizomicrobium sp.]|nr:hypothetical protein [Rhizomicrobium sp.]